MLSGGCALLPGREAPGLRYQLRRGKARPEARVNRKTRGAGLGGGWHRLTGPGLRGAAAAPRPLPAPRCYGSCLHPGPKEARASPWRPRRASWDRYLDARMRTWHSGKDGGPAGVWGRGTRCAHACLEQGRVREVSLAEKLEPRRPRNLQLTLLLTAVPGRERTENRVSLLTWFYTWWGFLLKLNVSTKTV